MRRCPACGRPLRLVHVHGHGQCAWCGTNVEDCCSGAGDEADARGGPALRVDTETLQATFARLGPPGTCVTEESLLHGLCTRLGWAWDEALRAVRAAVERDLLENPSSGVYRLPGR